MSFLQEEAASCLSGRRIILGKPFEELEFTDDYMFCRVLERRPDLCRRLLELVLQRKVGDLIRVSSQLPVAIRSDRKAVRFDVYSEDRSRVYIVEMQTRSQRDLPHRSRLYQAKADQMGARPGQEYGDLKENYTIFLCTFNPFEDQMSEGKSLHRYVFSNRCEQCPQVALRDGTYKIFLCTKGEAEDVSEEQKHLIEYLARHVPADDLTRQLEETVRDIKRDEKMKEDYFLIDDYWDEVAEDARAEGRAEGQTELGRLALRMQKDGREQEFFAAVADPARRDKLMEEYGILVS